MPTSKDSGSQKLSDSDVALLQLASAAVVVLFYENAKMKKAYEAYKYLERRGVVTLRFVAPGRCRVQLTVKGQEVIVNATK